MGIFKSVLGNYDGITVIDNEDHYAVVKVDGGKYKDFINVDCSQQIFEQGYYDDGTACKNASANENYCVCFRWTDENQTKQHKDGTHFSKVCGKCRDPNALTLETYKQGLYYDGMPCLNASVNDKFCVCFRWLDKKKTKQHEMGNHFSKQCGKCRDPNALIFP